MAKHVDARWGAVAVPLVLLLPLLCGCFRSKDAASSSGRAAPRPVTRNVLAEELAEEVAQSMSQIGARIIRNPQGSVHSVVMTDIPVYDSALKPLKELPHLEVLGLSGTRVTNSGMTHLTSIENLAYLFLNDTDVTDEGLLELADSVTLRFISLDNTAVTTQGVKEFLKLSPGTEVHHSPRNTTFEESLERNQSSNLAGPSVVSPQDALKPGKLSGKNTAGIARPPLEQNSANTESGPGSAGVRLRYRNDDPPKDPATAK